MQVFRPSSNLNQKLWGWGPAIHLQVILMHAQV